MAHFILWQVAKAHDKVILVYTVPMQQLSPVIVHVLLTKWIILHFTFFHDTAFVGFLLSSCLSEEG